MTRIGGGRHLKPVTRTEAAPKALLLRPAWTRDHAGRTDKNGPPAQGAVLSFRLRSHSTERLAYLVVMSTASEITPTDPKVLRVIEAGSSRNIEVRPVTFPAETRTAADAARAVGCEVGQIVKSLIFQAQGRPLLLLVSGANRVDLVKGATAAGVDRLEKAGADEARAVTGFSIGATPPFGHAHEIPVLMDADLLDFDEVWAAGGRPDTVFPVAPALLQAATRALAVDLRQS